MYNIILLGISSAAVESCEVIHTTQMYTSYVMVEGPEGWTFIKVTHTSMKEYMKLGALGVRCELTLL